MSFSFVLGQLCGDYCRFKHRILRRLFYSRYFSFEWSNCFNITP